MKFRIKIETLNNGMVYYTAQLFAPPPPTPWYLRWLNDEEEVWCNINSYGQAYQDDCCGVDLRNQLRWTSESVALQCIEMYKQKRAKDDGEKVATTEYKYL